MDRLRPLTRLIDRHPVLATAWILLGVLLIVSVLSNLVAPDSPDANRPLAALVVLATVGLAVASFRASR